MSRPSRLIASAGAAVALVLAVPAAATEPAAPAPAPPTEVVPGRPTAAVLRIDGGISPHERWLWFDGDGTARLRGMLVDNGPGRFKSHVDFKTVRAVLDDAHACGANVGPSRPTIGNDVLYYRVDVRCGTTWHILRDVARPEPGALDAPDMWKLVHGLEAVAGRLTWEPTSDDVALPNAALFRFAAPVS